MNPRNRHYQVKEGDSLSKIAHQHYGDAMVWPRIAAANRLPNSGLILVGMTLELPVLATGSRPSGFKPDTILPVGGGSTPAHHLSWPGISFSFEHDFHPLSFSLQNGEFQVGVKLTGEIKLWKKGSVGNVDIDTSNGKISAGVTKEYTSQFAQFVTETNFYYDAAKKRPGLEGGLAVTSGSATPEWAPKASIDPTDPRTLVFTQNPPLSVQFTTGAAWKFEGTLGFEITITQNYPAGKYPVLPQPALQTVNPMSIVQGFSLLGFIKGLLDGIIAAGGIVITIITIAGKEPLPVPAAIKQIPYAEAATLYRWSPQILR